MRLGESLLAKKKLSTNIFKKVPEDKLTERVEPIETTHQKIQATEKTGGKKRVSYIKRRIINKILLLDGKRKKVLMKGLNQNKVMRRVKLPVNPCNGKTQQHLVILIIERAYVKSLLTCTVREN